MGIPGHVFRMDCLHANAIGGDTAGDTHRSVHIYLYIYITMVFGGKYNYCGCPTHNTYGKLYKYIYAQDRRLK